MARPIHEAMFAAFEEGLDTEQARLIVEVELNRVVSQRYAKALARNYARRLANMSDRLAREAVEGREPESFGFHGPAEEAAAQVELPADSEWPHE